jgi:hypothetical protein
MVLMYEQRANKTILQPIWVPRLRIYDPAVMLSNEHVGCFHELMQALKTKE